MKGGSAVKKSITCIILSVLVCCSLVFSLPLTASAADNYIMNINEPSKGDNQGYILLLVESSSGTRQVQCVSWSLCPLDVNTDETLGSDDVTMCINVLSGSNSVGFYGYCSNNAGNIKYSVGFGRCLSGDSLRTSYWASYGNSSLSTAYTYSTGSSNIIGYQIYGDAILNSSDLGNNNNQPFSVTWGGDDGISNKLTQLIALATQMCDNDKTLISQLNSILSDTGAILTNTADIERLCTSVISWLSQIDGRLKVIQGNTDSMLKKLDTIISLLQGKGESTFDEPDTSAVDDYNKQEDELLSGADDTASDIEQEIEDFEIDADSSSVIWGIIQVYLNQSELVMGLVVGVLCLGIIALILNR